MPLQEYYIVNKTQGCVLAEGTTHISFVKYIKQYKWSDKDDIRAYGDEGTIILYQKHDFKNRAIESLMLDYASFYSTSNSTNIEEFKTHLIVSAQNLKIIGDEKQNKKARFASISCQCILELFPLNDNEIIEIPQISSEVINTKNNEPDKMYEAWLKYIDSHYKDDPTQVFNDDIRGEIEQGFLKENPDLNITKENFLDDLLIKFSENL